MSIQIRKGTTSDLQAAFELIKALAEYEKAPEQVSNSPEKMLKEFQEQAFDFFVAEKEGRIIGLALYFFSYSTWKGRSMYLDDLIVSEEYRRDGIGEKLLHAVISEAQKLQVPRLHWQVLDWNEPAIRFYQKAGAEFDSEWINCRIQENELRNYHIGNNSAVWS
jgi:GNAT superfamily N-acetyltransferase